MSKTTKIVLLAFAIYLLSKKSQKVGDSLTSAAGDYWTASAVFTVF